MLLILAFLLNSCTSIFTGKSGTDGTDISQNISDVNNTSSTETKAASSSGQQNDVTGTTINPAGGQIRVTNPVSGQLVKSPLIVEGEARGNWFFEATFPVKLLDENGKVIASHFAQTQEEWMTEDFISFTARIEFEKPATSAGVLLLEKDNPSGLPEHDASIEIQVRFE